MEGKKKLQQFGVMAFSYERIKSGKYRIDVSLAEAEANEEIVSLADSEVLRAIRRITGHRFDECKLGELYEERRRLSKGRDGVAGKRRIAEINAEISEMLFIPEYVSVVTSNKRSYPKIGRDGFFINGRKYVRLMCGAAHARTNRAIFCAEDIFEELDRVLRCGCKDVEIVPAKWNAYYALSSTATYRVRTPRVCVVADKEIKMRKVVDFVTEAEPQDLIERCEKELDFNLWDGMGIIDPTFAEEWASELGLDYLPSGFLVRAPFVKGMVATFDFKRFAREIAGKSIVVDLYGVEQDISEIDIILTQSQFKLWNGYDNWSDYERKLSASGLSWGVSHTTPNPEDEKHFARSNYQFVQVLEMSDKDIAELCEPTVDWIKGVGRDDYDKMILYLLGKASRHREGLKIWDSVQDSFLKALMLCPELINDEYIHSRILNSLNKRIKESYIGKLLLRGNFQTIFADPYGLCQHMFGMEITGLLKEGEHYCEYWSSRGVGRVCGLRSPMTWRSEVTELNFAPSIEQESWYKYINSGIIVNLWGLDYRLWSGADVDGDILFTTDNEVYLRCRVGGVPVVYEPQKASKHIIDRNKLYDVDMLGFNSEIGYITNCSTTLYEMQSAYEKGSREYSEIEDRLKLCCKFQSHEIDHAKGIKTKPFPKHFVERVKEDNDFGWADGELEFLNSITICKRPKFMRHLYSKYNREYKDFVSDFERYSRIEWGEDFESLGDNVKGTQEYKDFINYFNKRNPLLDTKGVMNKVCMHMESQLKEIKRKNKKCDNNEIFGVLFNQAIEVDEGKLSMVRDIYSLYLDFRKQKMLANSPFVNYEQFYKKLRLDALASVSSSLSELANLSLIVCYKENPTKAKDFVWDVFGVGIVDNLLNKYTSINIPILSDDGDIEYLSEKYKRMSVQIKEGGASFDGDFDDGGLFEELDVLD